MKSCNCQDFQATVERYTIRHKSILDILSKAQEANARLNRAVIKATTSCGCLEIQAAKQPFPAEAALSDLRQFMDSHLRGSLCEECQDKVETELGRLLFYLAALCNTLGLSLEEVMDKENERLDVLRVFNFT